MQWNLVTEWLLRGGVTETSHGEGRRKNRSGKCKCSLGSRVGVSVGPPGRDGSPGDTRCLSPMLSESCAGLGFQSHR